MRTRRNLLVIVLVLALGIIVPWLFQREPYYQGRSLSSWLKQSGSVLDHPQQISEAQNAIRALPIKKVLPKLLEFLDTSDGRVNLWLLDFNEKFREKPLDWRSAEDLQYLGMLGFQALGTNAAPAADHLGKLLDIQDDPAIVQRCLEALGKPAERIICQAVTNQNPRVREWAIDELAAVTDDVGVYIDRIKPRLRDSSDQVRATAVDAVGNQRNAPELAIPLLVDSLKDSSDSVSAQAANSLAGFGTNALGTFLTLSNLVENGGSNTASSALKTLIILASDRALPILTNCIARERPATDAALRQLAESAPNKALPIILLSLQSSDVTKRRSAFLLLHKYPINDAVEPAIQTAATDSDSSIADGARKILTDEYQTNHPDALLTPDEPSYGGKRLSEWLKESKSDSDEFPKNAKDAIRHMGTNALPTLLTRLVYVRPPFGLRAYDVNYRATLGFIALENQTTNVLPQLWAIMDGTNETSASFAMLATITTGSNAMPFLIKGMTNQFADVRNSAASLLSETFVKKFSEWRPQVVPLFVKLLNDPDPSVRENATNQLKEIDLEAARKAGIK